MEVDRLAPLRKAVSSMIDVDINVRGRSSRCGEILAAFFHLAHLPIEAGIGLGRL